MNKFNEEIIESFVLGRSDSGLISKIEKEANADPSFRAFLDTEKDILKALEIAGENELKESIQLVEDGLDQKGFFGDEDIIRSIDLSGERALRETIGEVADTIAQEPVAKVRKLPTLRILSIAASFALLMALGWWMFSGTDSSQDIYSRYYVAYQDDLMGQIDLELSETGFGGNERSFLEGLRAGLQQYNNGNMSEANARFGSLAIEFPNHRLVGETIYYQAMSYIDMGQYEEAIDLLEKNIEDLTQERQKDATWYLGLAYLMSEKESEAKNLFNQLRDDPEYGRAAIDIIRLIRN